MLDPSENAAKTNSEDPHSAPPRYAREGFNHRIAQKSGTSVVQPSHHRSGDAIAADIK
jgi:hypothetical protein